MLGLLAAGAISSRTGVLARGAGLLGLIVKAGRIRDSREIVPAWDRIEFSA